MPSSALRGMPNPVALLMSFLVPSARAVARPISASRYLVVVTTTLTRVLNARARSRIPAVTSTARVFRFMAENIFI